MVSRIAMPLFKQAQKGEADAQLALGKLYLEGGQGVKRDPGTAFYWLKQAASRGNAEARRLIGQGNTEPPPGEGVADAQTAGAAESHSANADVALADWLLSGRVAANEEVNAVDVLRRAAAKGERTAQLRLAMLLLAGEHGPDDAEDAIDWMTRAAQSGSRAAAVRLAEWYWERYDPEALRWLEQLADSTEPELLYRLGVMQEANGRSPLAAVMLERAAQLEHGPAQLCYGLLHASPLGRRATGVSHSLKRAASWLEKASQRGCAQASFELHRLFRLRQFSLKNATLAERYLETAARQGHAQAQFQCGVACMRETLGRDRDIEAATWLLQAAKQGHREARAICRLLYSKSSAKAVAFPEDPSRFIKLLARTRIALATRMEIGVVMGLDLPEMLLFDPETADRGDFLVLDVRQHVRRAARRIVAVDSPAERALLDRGRRLLGSRNPHPTDVRGPLSQRRLDLVQTLRLLGSENSEET